MKKILFKSSLVLMIMAITIVNMKGFSAGSKSLGNAVFVANKLADGNSVPGNKSATPAVAVVAATAGLVVGFVVGFAVGGTLTANVVNNLREQQAQTQFVPKPKPTSLISENMLLNKLD